MQWTLEVIVVPVADVDRAKAFYVDVLGTEVIPGKLVQISAVQPMSEEVEAAYSAPWPVPESKAGILAFPELVPTSPDHPDTPVHLAVREQLARLQEHLDPKGVGVVLEGNRVAEAHYQPLLVTLNDRRIEPPRHPLLRRRQLRAPPGAGARAHPAAVHRVMGTGSLPAVQYYVLGNGPESVSARPVSQRSSLLLVSPTSVNAFYDTQRLVFSRSEGQRAYSQFAAWTERPGRAFSELLARRLDAPPASDLAPELEELPADEADLPVVLADDDAVAVVLGQVEAAGIDADDSDVFATITLLLDYLNGKLRVLVDSRLSQGGEGRCVPKDSLCTFLELSTSPDRDEHHFRDADGNEYLLRLRALQDIGEALGSTLDLDELVGILARACRCGWGAGRLGHEPDGARGLTRPEGRGGFDAPAGPVAQPSGGGGRAHLMR
mgnify:CR=1 FL=1